MKGPLSGKEPHFREDVGSRITKFDLSHGEEEGKGEESSHLRQLVKRRLGKVKESQDQAIDESGKKKSEIGKQNSEGLDKNTGNSPEKYLQGQNKKSITQKNQKKSNNSRKLRKSRKSSKNEPSLKTSTIKENDKPSLQ